MVRLSDLPAPDRSKRMKALKFNDKKVKISGSPAKVRAVRPKLKKKPIAPQRRTRTRRVK